MASKQATINMELATLYPFIYATGEYWGSSTDYINDQLDSAASEGAPVLATHRDREDGGWHTLENLNEGPFKSALVKIVVEMRHRLIMQGARAGKAARKGR